MQLFCRSASPCTKIALRIRLDAQALDMPFRGRNRVPCDCALPEASGGGLYHGLTPRPCSRLAQHRRTSILKCWITALAGALDCSAHHRNTAVPLGASARSGGQPGTKVMRRRGRWRLGRVCGVREHLRSGYRLHAIAGYLRLSPPGWRRRLQPRRSTAPQQSWTCASAVSWTGQQT
jgi:hypothetical protein